jgi:hypothetical protein
MFVLITPYYAQNAPNCPAQTEAARGTWTTAEDDLLRQAVKSLGTTHWDQVAALVKRRTATQCRERWTFRLSPGLKKTPFEKWEDDLIIAQREKIGNHWTAIANSLPGRTSCAVKNRWYTVLRKKDEKQSPVTISNLLSKQAPERVFFARL